MILALDIASWICLIIGALLMVVSAIGLLRLPDLFTRLHSGGLADTGGAALLLLGMALQTDFDLVTVKIVLIGIVLVLTSPTASHAVAHSALLGGLSPNAPEANQARDESDKENP
ncbi:MAG: monovalent cation/H(+) antiporter subunit G [Rhodospirillales bacterium]|nr:monovalent cation/H(+) antiporter subunit G [Rhodospirillales bacterium]